MCYTDNMYPNTARIYTKDFTGNADMPYDFFMSRYKEAYLRETEAFCKVRHGTDGVPCRREGRRTVGGEGRERETGEPEAETEGGQNPKGAGDSHRQALVNDEPSPCTGEDGLFALIMALAAGKSAEEGRWVKFSEIPETIYCT